ncbi:hypothetical protein PHYBOEH_004937 [Phytophthora boehmeriae]|uniref:Poly(A) RNA polymerase mitochondrial-like central palm domain-containing protein n=1 Tax=Phytophthora boehmeriae TaxID=109152 RepID=A0A8T1X8M2_9STRA|nr:hypothetical protein PHYBOEH_004937 [Phytophthora boehmeriae]
MPSKFHRKASRAPGNRPEAATNWEKVRGAQARRQRPKSQLRGDKTASGSSKKVHSTRQERRERTRRRKRSVSHDSGAKTESGKANNEVSRETPLDAELRAFAELVALSPQERTLRQRVFDDVRELISAAFQDATVQLYGSSSTGLDTFRSDLDITVGNISINSSQKLPGRMAMQEEEDEDLIGGPEQDKREEESRDQPAGDVVDADDESSFSLNLALPVGTVVSQDNADITRRVLPTPKSHWNPTLRRRKIRVLRALQFVLKSQRPHFQVKCLHKAKTPILMVQDTKNKLAIDIGINREAFEDSEHGQSTSLALKLQKTLGAQFSMMVMFLKEFLHQFDIDKPFTGGLGSFRLYVMVAYVFQRMPKHKNKCQPCLSSKLLTFFELFGNKKQANFLHEQTQLPLPYQDGNCMNFSGVFRLSDCVETFAMAFDILSSSGHLGSIIFEERLHKDRKKSHKDIQQRV